MKRKSGLAQQLGDRLRRPPKITRLDVIVLLLPILGWAALFQSRDHIMTLPCATAPETCRPETVNAFDRMAIHGKDGHADQLSFVTQNSSGYLAVGIPAVWLGARAALRVIHPAAALAAFGTDVVLALQATAWNGFVLEVTRAVVQRPRPFVFNDPVQYGKAPSHYTSFYSGHTSFAALASTSFTLSLLARAAPVLLVGAAGVLGLVLTVLTGYFRVAAGRHYPTDVIVGAIAGIMIAGALALLHRDNQRGSKLAR